MNAKRQLITNVYSITNGSLIPNALSCSVWTVRSKGIVSQGATLRKALDGLTGAYRGISNLDNVGIA